MKINRLGDLEVFAMAARLGSFSEAARQMDLSPVVASAMIKRLEASLGVRLFERSTRSVRLSDAGARLLPHAHEALQALQSAEALLGQDWSAAERLNGPLRLAMPSDLGRSLMVGWIDQFLQEQGGGVVLELRISDRLSNLLVQPVDFALRYGVPEDSGLIALPVAPDNRRVLVAAPGYLARHGTPRQLSELREHQCLRFVVGDAVHSRWRFEGDNGTLVHDAQGERMADDGAVVRQWAVNGLGIAYKSQLDVAQDVASGRLQVLMPHLRGEPSPLYLLVVSRQRLSPGIRRLAQALEQRSRALLAGESQDIKVR